MDLTSEFIPTIFDPAGADEQDFRAFNALINTLRAESRPDDPPRSLQATINHLQGISALHDLDITIWVVRADERMIASAHTVVAHRQDNRHLMEGEIEVHPRYRRRGIGSRLLRELAHTARCEKRTLLLGGTTDRVPAGAAFAAGLGAERGQEAHTNQLVLAEVDRRLIASWQQVADSTAAAFEMGLWVGAYPEEELEEIAAMYEVMNTAPIDDLELEDFTVTPDMLRQREAYQAQRGLERWTLFVRHRPSGKLAGYTETFFDPDQPHLLEQGDSGVLPDYRGRGLGKWLKAAMIAKVLRERPGVRFIRTGNADSNAAMLAINRALGFNPYCSLTVWQVPLAKVENYLRNRGLEVS